MCVTFVITNTFNIECPVVSDSHKPPDPPEALHVVAFPLTPALADALEIPHQRGVVVHSVDKQSPAEAAPLARLAACESAS